MHRMRNRASDQEVLDEMLDVEMMERTHLWPQGLLPLIRKEDGEAGFLRSVPAKPVVYKSNVFLIGTFPNMAAIPKVAYDSYEMLAEEWRVD